MSAEVLLFHSLSLGACLQEAIEQNTSNHLIRLYTYLLTNQLQHTACLNCGEDKPRPLLATPAHMYAGKASFSFVQCSNCGLVYLNPQVLPDQLGQYYPAYYVPYRGAAAWGKYSKIAAWGLAGTDNKRAKKTLQQLRKNKGNRVLDVGCGHPTFLEALANHDGLQLTGIDFLDTGWREEPARWHGMTLQEVDPKAYTNQTPFDAITMWHYLEHDYAPRETLQHLLAVSHANTRLIIEVPDYDSVSRKWFGSYWEGWHAPRHTGLYTKDTLADVLDRSGWRVEQAYKYGTMDVYALWWMSRMEQKGLDWTASLEKAFPAFLAGKILTMPFFALQRWLRLGVQLVVAKPKN